MHKQSEGAEMFTVHKAEIKKIKTLVWASSSFPNIHAQREFAGFVVTRCQDCLEMSVHGQIVEINKQSLSMGQFRLDNLESLSYSQQQSAWLAIEAMKLEIDSVKL
jgi:hypothetical protein